MFLYNILIREHHAARKIACCSVAYGRLNRKISMDNDGQ